LLSTERAKSGIGDTCHRRENHRRIEKNATFFEMAILNWQEERFD
jgi:hypothetical protein